MIKVIKLEDGIEELVLSLCNFGYKDLKTTVDVLKRYEIPAHDFSDYVEEFMDSTGMNLVNKGQPLDVCALAYDYALQQARNEIDRRTGFDIMNDADYYVLGDYFCSSIDYSEEDKYRLIEAVCSSEEEDRQALLDNQIVKMFFKDVDVLENVEKCHQTNR